MCCPLIQNLKFHYPLPMKLPRSTLILIFIALGLGGFVYFHDIQGATQQAEKQDQKPPVFSFTADDVQSLTVQIKKYTLNLERNHRSDQTKWLITAPISEPANDAIVSYLMDALIKGKIERTLSIAPNQLGEFGLDKPQGTINIKLKNQQTHELIVGQYDFDHNYVYAQADPDAKQKGNVNVLLVSTDFANAINRDLSEWRQFNDNKQTPLPSLPPILTPKTQK